MRMYAACLASYNNGVLHGEWFDLADYDDVQELQDAIAYKVLQTSRFPNVLVNCPHCDGLGHNPETIEACSHCLPDGSGKVRSAEEWAAHDYDGEGLSSYGEYPDLEGLLEHVRLSTKHGSSWLAFKGAFGDSVTEDDYENAYRGEYESMADFAEEFVCELHGLKGDEPFFYWIDWERAARDMEQDFTFSEGYVFYNSW